jgi:hypothetical protein
MQIPNHDNQVQLLQMYAYLMYTHEIKRIIDLHSCGTGLHPRAWFIAHGEYEQCSRDGRVNGERKAWEYLKTLEITNNNDPEVCFIDNLEGVGIEDMTAGNINIWRQIDNYFPYDIVDPNGPKTVVHCQAGFGRTGSVFLYLIIRDIARIEHLLYRSYLGAAVYPAPSTGDALWNILFNYFNYPGLNNMRDELFNISTQRKQQLFLKRFNLILCTIYHKNVLYGQYITLYLINVPGVNRNTPNTIFNNYLTGRFDNPAGMSDDFLIALNLL